MRTLKDALEAADKLAAAAEGELCRGRPFREEFLSLESFADALEKFKGLIAAVSEYRLARENADAHR